MDIKEFRQKYPQYNDIPDWELARRLHARYYRDMDFKEFAKRFGLVEEPSFEAKHPELYAAGKAAVETVKTVGRSFKDIESALQGAEEAAASFLTGTYTLPISGLAMLYHLGKKFFQKGKIEDKDLDEAIKKGEQIGSIFQYKPKTKYGKIYGHYLGEVMSWPSEVIRELGSKLVEKGVHPAIVTAITTPLEFGAYGLLFKGAEGLIPRARTLREVQWPKEEPTVGVREEIKTPEAKPEPEIKPEKEEVISPEKVKPEKEEIVEPEKVEAVEEPKPETAPEVKTEVPEGPTEEVQEIDTTPVLKRGEVRKYRPYPLMGNKEQLITQKGYHDILKAGVESSDRVIDAFMGTGVNSNVLPLITDKKIPVIKNEFNKFRYNAYKALQENPDAVIEGVKKHVKAIKDIQDQFDLPYDAKKSIEKYLKEQIEKDPSVYIVAQHLTPSSRPINEAKDITVDIRKSENKIRGFKSFQTGEIEKRLKNVASVLKEYPHEIRQGDAWELIAKEAKPNDLVIVDPDYLPEKGRKVAGYGATVEDKNLKTFLNKFDRIILPKAKSGVKFIVTNTWDEGLANALRERGFKVFRTKRRSAKSVKDELIAANFDEKSGRVLTVYDTADARRGLEEVGKGLSKQEGLGEGIDYNVGRAEGEVEGTGSARLPDEIRGGGRGRGGITEEERQILLDRGFTENQINKLLPEEAQQLIVEGLYPEEVSVLPTGKVKIIKRIEKPEEQAKPKVWQMTPEEYAEKSGLPADKAYEEWKQKVIESEFEVMPHEASKEALEVLDEWHRQSAGEFEPYQEEMFEQAKEPLWRQFEVVNKILQEEGINSEELNSLVGITGIQEIRSKFGVKVVKKNGLPLDEFGKRVREEAPDLLPEDYDINDVIDLLESTPSRKQIKEMTGVIRYYREKGQEVPEEPEISKGGIEFKPIPEGRRRSAIIEHISKKLEIPIRIGKFRTLGGKRLGVYKPREKVIRLAKANDLETVFHEIGHYIQDLLGFPKEMPDEVRRLAYEGAKDIDGEGFAEFVRYYITNPTKARNKAPNFYAVFEQRVKAFPDVQDVLDKAREAWNLWKQAPAAAKIDSLIVRGDKKKFLLTKETFNQIYARVKDNLYPLQLLKKEAEKRLGRELLPSENPYLLARLTRGWARKAEQYLKYGTFQYDPVEGVKFTGKSLREILEPVAKKGELSLLEDYLIAKRALYDERILKGFEGILTKEDFRKVVDELEPKFKDVAEEIYKYSDELLKYLVDSGRISEELAKTIKKKNLFYVPFYRVMDYEPTSGRLSSRKFSNLFNPIKRLKGSSRDIYSPLESLIYNTYVMINAAERNRVGEALIKLSQVPGMGKFIERVPFRMKPIKITKGEALKGLLSGLSKEEKEYFLKQLGDLPKEVLQEMFVTFRPNIKPGPNEVLFYDKGKPVLFEVTPDLAEALNNIDAANLSVLVKILSYPAKWLRAGATTFSPEFALRNLQRDQLTAFIQSKYGFVPFFDFLRGLFHILKKDELWQRFNASGAAHSALVSLDRDYLSQNLKKLIKGSKIKGLVKSPLELLQALSEFTEEATRVGEFARAIKKEGKDYEALLKAGMVGREITMDFARQGGKTARFLNAISAFWNARIEGIDKMIRTFKENPLKASVKAFLAVTLPSLILWYIQKDDPYYQELPEWRKVLFWNIVLHNKDGSLKKIILFPKPFEYGLIFGSIPEAAMDWIYRNDPAGMKKTAIQIAEALKFDPIPTAAVPIIEWWANKSMFFDRPIVPRGKEALEPVLQYSPYTSETVKLIAELMDKVPGLKEIASPAKIENLIHGYFAAMGDLALKAGDWLIEKFGVADVPPEPKMTLADLPGVRAFIARFPSANTKSIEEFYEKYNRLNQKWESYRQRIGVRGWGTRIKFPAEFAKLEYYRRAAKTLSMLRKMADCIYENPTLTPEKKREMLDNIYLSMINVARAALGKGRLK